MNSASAYPLKVAGAVEGCDMRGGPVESTRDLLESVWRESSGDLGGMVAAMGVPPDRSEDLLHDVYLVALEKPPSISERVELRQWLFRVAANRCRLEHRKQKRWRGVWRKIVQYWTPCGDEQRARLAERKEEAVLIAAALESLPEAERTALVLRYYSGFNAKEIGQILDSPHNTIRSYLRRGRRRLAESLRELGPEHE